MAIQRQAGSAGRVPKSENTAVQILPAMPVKIRVLSSEQVRYTLETQNGTPIFRVHYSGKDDPPEQHFDENWDAFALRAAFDGLTTPKEGLAFLNELGCLFRVLRPEPKGQALWILPWF